MPADQTSSGGRMPIGLLVAGSEMASFTIMGVLLDFGLGTMPIFTIVLTLVGVGLAFFHIDTDVASPDREETSGFRTVS